MKTVKQTTNTTGLKVKFLPGNGSFNNRIRITQMNSNKSIITSYPSNLMIIDHVINVLESIEIIESFSILVDNTQNNTTILNLEFKYNSFENILPFFKN